MISYHRYPAILRPPHSRGCRVHAAISTAFGCPRQYDASGGALGAAIWSRSDVVFAETDFYVPDAPSAASHPDVLCVAVTWKGKPYEIMVSEVRTDVYQSRGVYESTLRDVERHRKLTLSSLMPHLNGRALPSAPPLQLHNIGGHLYGKDPTGDATYASAKTNGHYGGLPKDAYGGLPSDGYAQTPANPYAPAR